MIEDIKGKGNCSTLRLLCCFVLKKKMIEGRTRAMQGEDERKTTVGSKEGKRKVGIAGLRRETGKSSVVILFFCFFLVKVSILCNFYSARHTTPSLGSRPKKGSYSD